MNWLGFIIASAVTLSLYDICKKHSAAANRTFPVLFLTTLAGFAAVTATLAASGSLQTALAIQSRDILLLVAKSCIVSASWSFAYLALKTLPVTVMAPIRATGPIWTTLAAMFLFAEIPTLIQAAGFFLAFSGCIAFSLATRREGYSVRSKAIVFALLATFFGAASALYDKLLINSLGIQAKVVLFWFMGVMTIIYGLGTLASTKLDKTPFVWRWTIPAVGILLALSDFLYFTAISSPEARISILSTIRRTSTIGTFLIGGAIFREMNLLRKGIALAAILIGVVLLCIG